MQNILRYTAFIIFLYFQTLITLAGTVTSTLTVQTTVVTNCTVSTGTVNFGNVDTVSLQSNSVNSSGTFTTTCTNTTPYTIALGNGANFTTIRNMKGSGAPLIPYTLYQNSARTTQWDSTHTVSATGTGAAQTNTVYGTISLGSYTLATGAYTDSVVITVTF